MSYIESNSTDVGFTAGGSTLMLLTMLDCTQALRQEIFERSPRVDLVPYLECSSLIFDFQGSVAHAVEVSTIVCLLSS